MINRFETNEPLALLDSELVEKILKELIDKFKDKIPSHFGKPRAYISPLSSLQSVIRADCKNPNCGTRAVIHIGRINNQWSFLEEKPSFDRIQNSTCEKCKKLLNI